eukprot:9386334-Pyramimonas_sp.AAC.1
MLAVKTHERVLLKLRVPVHLEVRRHAVGVHAVGVHVVGVHVVGVHVVGVHVVVVLVRHPAQLRGGQLLRAHLVSDQEELAAVERLHVNGIVMGVVNNKRYS